MSTILERPAIVQPPSNSIEISVDEAANIIGWLNRYLALYANEVIALRQAVAERDRKIEWLVNFINDLGRQEWEARS